MVRRTFKNLDIEDFRLLYKTYIIPHLEFCIKAWSPHFVKDIAILENVQKAATTHVAEIQLSCETTNDRLHLTGR